MSVVCICVVAPACIVQPHSLLFYLLNTPSTQNNKEVILKHVLTAKMIADILTKRSRYMELFLQNLHLKLLGMFDNRLLI